MRTSLLLSLATLTVVLGALSAEAETVDSAKTGEIALEDTQQLNLPATDLASNSTINQIQAVNPTPVDTATKPALGTFLTSASSLKAETLNTTYPTLAQTEGSGQQTPTPGTPEPFESTPSTTPGTTPTQTSPQNTTPGTITPDTTTPTQTFPDTTPSQPSPTESVPSSPPPDTTTPRDTQVSPGRATRSGPSYIGIGGNIGVGDGGTALGDGSFVVLSKVGLTNTFSVRPSIFVNDDPTILIPVTYDFVPRGIAPVRASIAPYLGAGIAISISDDSAVDLLFTGGIDVPVSTQFTATAAINVTAFDNAAVGLLVGIGYNF